MDSSVDAAIIGMGYVGLPLAREASAAGLSVIGLDINPEVIDGLNHGRSHVDDLADSDVAEMVDRGFRATTDAVQLSRARTIVICTDAPLQRRRPRPGSASDCGWLGCRPAPRRHSGDLGIHDVTGDHR